MNAHLNSRLDYIHLFQPVAATPAILWYLVR